jgi:hypothetical protein
VDVSLNMTILAGRNFFEKWKKAELNEYDQYVP